LYAGLPVVTSAIGGGAEVVDDSCGVLTPPADPGALAAPWRASSMTTPDAHSWAEPGRKSRSAYAANQLRSMHELLAPLARARVLQTA
jgi:hypothetical protein